MVVFRSVRVRSQRRLRLTFDTALGIAAFNASYYALESVDGCTRHPTVLDAMAVGDLPSEVELALGSDVAPAGQYKLTLSPLITDAGGNELGPSEPKFFGVPAPPRAPSIGFNSNDLFELIFNVDLSHTGSRFVESPDGDIGTVTGPDNVKGAAVRRALSEGLPHDVDYGGKLRQDVDAPVSLLPRARARVEDQLRQDDRVLQSVVTLGANRNDGTVTLNVNLELVGGVRTSAQTQVKNARY